MAGKRRRASKRWEGLRHRDRQPSHRAYLLKRERRRREEGDLVSVVVDREESDDLLAICIHVVAWSTWRGGRWQN